MRALQLMQGLTAAANQALTRGETEVGVGAIGLAQFRQRLLLVNRQGERRRGQLPGEESAEGLAASHEISEAAIRLKLQSLLQRAQPSLQP